MKMRAISVTEVARNFADCVNRVRYQGAAFVLLKNDVPVARIVPERPKPRNGAELAAALREALKGAHLTKDEADAWLHDLEDARNSLIAQKDKWLS